MLKQLYLAFLLLYLFSPLHKNTALGENVSPVITDSINHYILQGNDYLAKKNYNTAIFNYHYADSLATLNQDYNSSAMSKHNAGLCYFRLGEYLQCRDYFEQAIKLSEKEGDELKTAHYQISLGALFQKQDMLESSMQYIMSSIAIAEKHEDQELLLVAFNTIAGIQNTLENYDEALNYYLQVVDICSETNNESALGKAFNNLGNVYKKAGNLELSLKYYFKSIEKKEGLEKNNSIINTYKNIGDVYLSFNQSDSAASYYLKALKNAKTKGHISKQVMILNSLTKLEMQKESFNSASQYLNQLSSMDMENIGNDLLLDYFKTSKQVYIATHQYKKAIHFSNLYDLKKDEIFNTEKTKGLNELRFQYETNKKDETIKHLNEVDALKNKSISIKNRSIAIMVISLLLISTMSIGLFRAYRRKKKDNKYIRLLMKEARHRIQNNLQLLSSILRLYSDQVDEEHRDAVMSAEHRVQSIVLLNQQLELEKNKSQISLSDYIQSLAESLIEVYTLEDHIQLDINLSDVQIPAHQAIHLGLIANELITNSLKYAFDGIPQPSINIHCILMKDKQCKFVVQDNGVGLDENKTSHSSFGMGLINDLSEQLYGDVLMENREGFYFQLVFKIK